MSRARKNISLPHVGCIAAPATKWRSSIKRQRYEKPRAAKPTGFEIGSAIVELSAREIDEARRAAQKTAQDEATRRKDGVAFEQAAAPIENADGSVTIRVSKNVRVHPLDTMFARGLIDETQKRAGDKFLEIYQRAEIGGAKAIDYSGVRVDCSGTVDFDAGRSNTAIGALLELKRIRQELGARPYSIIEQFLGQRVGVNDIASTDGKLDQSQARYVGRTIGYALDDLASLLRIVAVGKSRKAAPYSREIRETNGKREICDFV